MEQTPLTASAQHGPDAANPSLPPDTILQGRYRIVRQLGRGGMGAVYEAVDQRLEITVALKETFSAEASMRRQFEHEARILAGMQHPALPRVSDHFVEGNRAFLVMQFIGGVDLARIISKRPGRPFQRDYVIAWADQLLDALIYLHSRDRQVIHRDIKPHNLKLTKSGQIALLDFGLAKAQPSDSSSATSSRALFGYTRHYAPLEQIQDQRTDPRSDIYALGATLYHLLTGEKPPDAMVRATALLNSEPDPLKAANKILPAVGPDIAAILDKAMAQKPEDRYASANEFREDLRRVGRADNEETHVPSESTSRVEVTHARVPEVAPLKMAMVESARRFGPANFTAVLVAIMTLAAGIMYGSERWFQSPEKAPTEPSANVVATQRQAGAARKSDRPRTIDYDSATAAKTRATNNTNPVERISEKKRVDFPGNAQAPKDLLRGARGSERGKSLRRINAPGVRLPSPELLESFPAPAPAARIHFYGPSSAPQK